MSWFKWIVDNLDSDNFRQWALANGSKLAIEIALSCIFAALFFVVVYAIVSYTDRSLPFGVAGPIALYLLLVYGAWNHYWNCRMKTQSQ